MFIMHSLWYKMLAREITNNFWKCTLLSWANVIDSIPQYQNDKVLNSLLWYNPLISNVHLLCQDRYSKGIIFMADLFCEGKFLSLEELITSLKIKTNFLEYHRIKPT